jgi:hypothetical protein
MNDDSGKMSYCFLQETKTGILIEK